MTGDLTTNMTPDLQSMIASYEAYYATPAYASWKATDSVSREMQWRLSQVDIVEAVNSKATIPPSFAADGIGTAAPGLGDITIAAGLSPNSGDVVATGGKSSEIVFGDDGDIVYTGD